MENPTCNAKETNLVLQLIQEPLIKSKTVMSWHSQKKKEGIFVPFILSYGHFLIFLFYLNAQCIEYIFRIYNFLLSKNITSYTFLIAFKIAESLQCILSGLELFSFAMSKLFVKFFLRTLIFIHSLLPPPVPLGKPVPHTIHLPPRQDIAPIDTPTAASILNHNRANHENSIITASK